MTTYLFAVIKSMFVKRFMKYNLMSNINLIVFIVVLFFRLFNITYSLHVLVYL